MKKAVAFAIGVLCFFLTNSGWGLELFRGGIHFSPPDNYVPFGLTHDPGDNPFSGDGPGVQFLENGGGGRIDEAVGGGAIILRVSMIGFSIGNGKVVTYQRINSLELRRIMQEEVSRGGSKARVEPVSLSGLQGGRVTFEAKMSSGAPFKTRLIQTTWLQLETNCVLKIMCLSPRKSGLDEIVKSINTLRVDKKKLFASFQPVKPNVTRDQLESVTSGFIKIDNTILAAFALRCRSKTYFFTSEDTRKPEEIVLSLEEAMKKVNEHLNDPQIYSHALISITRTGSGENDIQQQCDFQCLDRRGWGNVTEEDVVAAPDKYSLKNVGHRDGFWIRKLDSVVPTGFRKFREYRTALPLFIVRRESAE